MIHSTGGRKGGDSGKDSRSVRGLGWHGHDFQHRKLRNGQCGGTERVNKEPERRGKGR